MSFLLKGCFLSFGIALLISACSPAPEPPLRIGTNLWPGYEPLYLARDLGHFDNTSIKLVELTSASEVIHALRNGMLEGAALTLDEALMLLDDGFDLKVILLMDFSHGADVLLAKPEITSLAALRGKRIAVENSSVGAILLDGALHKANLTPSDIEIVPCSVDEHLECYEYVDAVVTFEPFKTKLLQLGAKQLFDSSQIPTQIIDVLVVPKVTAQHRPHALKILLDGYFKACQYLATQPDDAAKRMAARMGLTATEVLAAFDEIRLLGLGKNRALMGKDRHQLNESTQALANLLLKRKLLKNRVVLQQLFDNRFLPNHRP